MTPSYQVPPRHKCSFYFFCYIIIFKENMNILRNSRIIFNVVMKYYLCMVKNIRSYKYLLWTEWFKINNYIFHIKHSLSTINKVIIHFFANLNPRDWHYLINHHSLAYYSAPVPPIMYLKHMNNSFKPLLGVFPCPLLYIVYCINVRDKGLLCEN